MGSSRAGNQVTEFVGTGTMNVDFYTPDSATGSHFANVRVNGTGTVNLQDHVDILGTLDVVQGHPERRPRDGGHHAPGDHPGERHLTDAP